MPLETNIRIPKACILILNSWVLSGVKYPDTESLYSDTALQHTKIKLPTVITSSFLNGIKQMTMRWKALWVYFHMKQVLDQNSKYFESYDKNSDHRSVFQNSNLAIFHSFDIPPWLTFQNLFVGHFSKFKNICLDWKPYLSSLLVKPLSLQRRIAYKRNIPF